MKSPITLAKNLLKQGKQYWKTPPKGKFLTLKEIMFFGAGGLGVNFIISVTGLVITASQLPEIYGIPVIHGVIVFIIASTAGIFAQLAFGKMLQNAKRTKFGRYKPFLLFLAPIVAVFALLSSWAPQNLGMTQRIVFVYCTSVPTLILLNLLLNTFNMLPGVISPNKQERVNVWTPVNIILNLAPTLLGVVKGFIRSYFLARGQEYMAFRFIGVFGVVVGVCLTVLIIKVHERVYELPSNTERVGLMSGLKQVIRNRPLMILTLALILGSLRVCIESSSEVIGKLRYGNTFAEGMKTFSALTLIVGFAATPNMILLPILTKKFNNRAIMIGWQIINTVAYVILVIIGYENIPVGAISATVITALRFMALFNAVGSLLPLMLAEIYDYQQWKTGKRLEGFIQTFAYAVVLMATQFALLIPAVIQAKMGYTPNTYFDKEVHQVTNAEIKTALDYYKTALIISIISGALFILVMLFYNLDKNKYEKIMAELKEKNLNTEINQTNDEDLNTTNPTDGSIESLAEDLKSEHINTIETENNQAV